MQGKVPVAEVEVDYLPGLNAAFRRDALELVNGYDPEFARMAEDVDLSIRLRNIGLNLIAVPGAVVTHRQRSDFSTNLFTISFQNLSRNTHNMHYHHWKDLCEGT